MNLRERILAEHSKANCKRIVDWIGNDQEKFDMLVDLVINGDYKLAQRGSWPMSDSVKNNPAFANKHIRPLLNALKKAGIHNAVRRNIIRLLQFSDLPEEFQGEIMEACFNNVLSPTEEPAVKA